MNLCQCGCGQLAPIASKTKSSVGHRKGEPMRYLANHQPRPGRTRRSPVEALAQHVEASVPDVCWPWRGHTDEKGYGSVGIGRRQVRAHRLAYEEANGPIPPGFIVRHSCDNPPCCNPRHLLVGTHQDNTNDKVSRRRHRFGETHRRARLTERAVLEARARYAGGTPVLDMAREYGVAEATLRQAINGTSWKHLGETA